MCKLRQNGYLAAMSRHGLDYHRIVHTDFTSQSVLSALTALYQEPTRPDAVFVPFDSGAVDALLWCREQGVQVPQQLAIAGYGDDPASCIVSPALTTYRQSPYLIGQTAFIQLMEVIDHGYDLAAIQSTIASGGLVIREST